MKRLIIGGAIVVGILLVVLSPYGLMKYYTGTRGVIRDEVRKSVSDPIIIRMTADELQKKRERLQEAKARLIEVDQRLDQRKRILRRWEGDLASEKEILQRAEKMLASEATSYEIAGKTYSHLELLTDIELRVSTYKSMHERIESSKQAIALLENIKNEGAEKIREGERVLAEKVPEFESLKIRLANAKVAKDIDQIRGDLEQIIPSMEFMGFQELTRRVAISEAGIADLSSGIGTGSIAWGEPNSATGVLNEIRSLPGWEADPNAVLDDSANP